MRFEFATAGRILVGAGVSSELPALAQALGQRALLVLGAGARVRGGAVAQRAAELRAAGLIAAEWPVAGEPTIAAAEQGAALAQQAACTLVIGIGGGSVLDSAKAIAALAANPGGALDYLEVVGAGRPLEHPALPVLAVPTTAGTGSEVTRNAVLAAPEQRAKASLRHASMLPRVALVDPELTLDLPPQITAWSGLDALTQLLEPYVSCRAQPLTDGLCLQGLELAAWALPRAYHEPRDLAAREAMCTASLMGGLALANAGLGAVHGIAAPLGGGYPAPHGAVCAALLPHIVATNIAALQQRDPDGPGLPRYERVAEVLLGRRTTEQRVLLADLVHYLHSLVAELAVPGLARYGLTEAAIPGLAQQAARASSMRANPLVLTQAELEAAIRAAL